jgi:hypothetical protein
VRDDHLDAERIVDADVVAGERVDAPVELYERDRRNSPERRCTCRVMRRDDEKSVNLAIDEDLQAPRLVRGRVA